MRLSFVIIGIFAVVASYDFLLVWFSYRSAAKSRSILNLLNAARDRSDASIHEAFLRYAEELQANNEKVKFNATFTLSAAGNACFNFVVAQAGALCPYPSIRLRLSGRV
jgi:hypothetical protein